jgi:dolichyl-phosphate-mannose--protein O-mannosyl transferase/Gpi18-like mannosyltransferase
VCNHTVLDHIDLSKKFAFAALALVAFLCIAPLFGAGFGGRALADGEELLKNGSFEENDGETPAYWDTNCWDTEDGFTEFTVDPAGGKDGGAAACIENFELNDSRFTQKVSVKPGKLYRLSGDIRVQGADGTWGATLSFENTFTYTEPLFESNGWRHVEVSARAGDGQTSVPVFARLGGYGSTCHGKAWFDNVSLVQVDSLPSGVAEQGMATNKPSSGSSSNPNAEGQYLPYIILIAAAFTAFMLWAFRRTDSEGRAGPMNAGLYVFGALAAGGAFTVIQFVESKFTDIISGTPALDAIEYTRVDPVLGVLLFFVLGLIPALAFLLAKGWMDEKGRRRMDLIYVGFVALALRCTIAMSMRGYPNDIDCWLGWAGQAASGQGLSGLFHMYGGGFNDYPPGYMYVLWFVGKLNALIPAPRFQLLMVKLPSILADIGTAYFIYRLAERRLSQRAAMIVALLYAFNPLVLLDSSAWGQIDSILALVAVGCFWQVYRGRMGWAAVLYGVGLLVKPQMLLFAPVMLAALVNACRSAGSFEKGLFVCLKTLGAGIGTVLLLALPFWVVQVREALAIDAAVRGDALNQALLWLPNQYLNSLGTYKDASINACNLLAFFGGNWTPDTKLLFGLPYYVWGYLGMGLVSIYAFCMMVFRDRDNRRVFLWAAALIAGIFVLGVRMHERYMYPALALLLVYYVLERDRRALYLFGFFTLTQFLNVAIVLGNMHMSTDTLPLGIFTIANTDGFGLWVLLISAAAFAAFVYTVYATAKAPTPLLWRGQGPEDQQEARRERIREDLAVSPEASRIPLKRKDWLIMGGLTLVYAVVALVYLGSLSVPHTMWEAQRTGDWAVIDFGRTVDIAQIWHYDGLTKGNMTVSMSEDGVNWTDELEMKHRATAAGENDDLGIYMWKIDSKLDEDQQPIIMEARYVRLTVTLPPVRLLEIAFKDPDGNVIAPERISDSGGADAALAPYIIDEQDLLPERPSFMNSMYFDEIYHARTGWEFTQGLQPYEWTHPPFGKDLISLGILIFGMVPFGWRFMGTLMGIFMVPVMYLFGMAVFKRTRYAFITAFLFTFDFMHFVQTRIATIDSYAVLFIMLTFLCMYLYLNKNFNTQKLRHTLLPLALSGLFFGFASASKWIGIYAGAGLALMFFYSLYRRWREYRAVRDGEVELDDGARQKVLRAFWRKAALTVAFCGVFFIAIPAVIYFASYIPFNIASAGGKLSAWDSFKYAWDNQSAMYRYHSQLVDNHAFRSAWYQWPLMIKPMWFYKADYLEPGTMGSIATFGNPAVWWPGAAALVWLAVRLFKSRRFRLPEAFMLAGMLTEFLPWVLVSRTMFIYHYFASVPFFTIAIVLYIREWEQRRGPADRNAQLQVVIFFAAAVFVGIFAVFVKFTSILLPLVLAFILLILLAMYLRQVPLELYRRDLTHVYLAVVLALFILFYPTLSGLPVPSWYGALLKWMPTWWFTY